MSIEKLTECDRLTVEIQLYGKPYRLERRNFQWKPVDDCGMCDRDLIDWFQGCWDDASKRFGKY